METANISKREAIEIATKVLKDIGEWEDFVIEKGVYIVEDKIYGYNHWLVSFNFSEHDFHDGIIVPMLIIDDNTGIATHVSWGRVEFPLLYENTEGKYYKQG